MDESPKKGTTPKFTIAVLVFVGVLAAVIMARTVINGLAESAKTQPPKIELPQPPEAKRPRTPEEVAKPHLVKAEQECDRVISEHVDALDKFFVDAKKNTRGFAEYALGWGSKRRLIQDILPWTSGEAHKKFIGEKFQELVFKPSDLEDAVKKVVKSYLSHVRSIESKLLVDLRTDTSDFPSAYLLSQLDDKKLQESYDAALTKAADATGNRLQEEIVQEIVSTISGAVIAQVAVRLGTQAGILGAGAATSPYTLGASVIVAVIVSYIWDWWSDPEGKLVAEMDKKLDEMSRLIMDGSTDVTGLRDRLREFARERTSTRQRAVISLLRPTTEVAR